MSDEIRQLEKIKKKGINYIPKKLAIKFEKKHSSIYNPNADSNSEVDSVNEKNINKNLSIRKGTLGGALAKEDNRPVSFRLTSKNCQKIVKKVLGIDKEKFKQKVRVFTGLTKLKKVSIYDD